MTNLDLKKVLDKMLEMAEMILDFSKINRVTLHYDKISPESDTDHTVMLSVMACALAKEFYSELDLGKVSQFAIIHDLVEVYAGDTNTISMTEELLADKMQRENLALLKIKDKFSSDFPWIHETIEEYESLKTKEARFVKTLDKLLPCLTVVLNSGAQFKDNMGVLDDIGNLHNKIIKAAAENYAKEFPDLIKLYLFLTDKILEINSKL